MTEFASTRFWSMHTLGSFPSTQGQRTGSLLLATHTIWLSSRSAPPAVGGAVGDPANRNLEEDVAYRPGRHQQCGGLETHSVPHAINRQEAKHATVEDGVDINGGQ